MKISITQRETLLKECGRFVKFNIITLDSCKGSSRKTLSQDLTKLKDGSSNVDTKTTITTFYERVLKHVEGNPDIKDFFTGIF